MTAPIKRLAMTWVFLMALSLGTYFAATVSSIGDLGAIWMLVLFIITYLKARFVLFEYLELREAKGGWRPGFSWLVGVTLILIYGLYMINK